MLVQYDQALSEREGQLKLYKRMLQGDFSHVSMQKRHDAIMIESNKDLVKQLIP